MHIINVSSDVLVCLFNLWSFTYEPECPCSCPDPFPLPWLSLCT